MAGRSSSRRGSGRFPAPSPVSRSAHRDAEDVFVLGGIESDGSGRADPSTARPRGRSAIGRDEVGRTPYPVVPALPPDPSTAPPLSRRRAGHPTTGLWTNRPALVAAAALLLIVGFAAGYLVGRIPGEPKIGPKSPTEYAKTAEQIQEGSPPAKAASETQPKSNNDQNSATGSTKKDGVGRVQEKTSLAKPKDEKGDDNDKSHDSSKKSGGNFDTSKSLDERKPVREEVEKPIPTRFFGSLRPRENELISGKPLVKPTMTLDRPIKKVELIGWQDPGFKDLLQVKDAIEARSFTVSKNPDSSGKSGEKIAIFRWEDRRLSYEPLSEGTYTIDSFEALACCILKVTLDDGKFVYLDFLEAWNDVIPLSLDSFKVFDATQQKRERKIAEIPPPKDKSAQREPGALVRPNARFASGSTMNRSNHRSCSPTSKTARNQRSGNHRLKPRSASSWRLYNLGKDA